MELQNAIAPPAQDPVREPPSLAPVLRQMEGLLTDFLAERLRRPVTTKVLDIRRDPIGLIRHSVVSVGDVPAYFAATVIWKMPRTRALMRTLRQEPALLFGEALRRHGLFARKGLPSISQVEFLPDYQRLFGIGGNTSLWSRSYPIFDKRGKRIAGITEIFSPKLEALLAKASARPESRGGPIAATA